MEVCVRDACLQTVLSSSIAALTSIAFVISSLPYSTHGHADVVAQEGRTSSGRQESGCISHLQHLPSLRFHKIRKVEPRLQHVQKFSIAEHEHQTPGEPDVQAMANQIKLRVAI